MTAVQHPHGNHSANPGMGAHASNTGIGGGMGAKARDPGGFTSAMSHGGSLPGGTKGGKQHVQVSSGTV